MGLQYRDCRGRERIPFPCTPSPYRNAPECVRDVPGLKCQGSPRPYILLTRNSKKDFYLEEHRDEGPVSSSHAMKAVCPERPSGARDLSSNPRRKCVLRSIAAIRDSGPFAGEFSLTFQPANLPTCQRSLFRPIHRDSAQHLGIEIRGLLWHHFARRRDFHHLLDVAGIQQKRNLRPPAVYRLQRRAGLALVY